MQDEGLSAMSQDTRPLFSLYGETIDKYQASERIKADLHALLVNDTSGKIWSSKAVYDRSDPAKSAELEAEADDWVKSKICEVQQRGRSMSAEVSEVSVVSRPATGTVATLAQTFSRRPAPRR